MFVGFVFSYPVHTLAALCRDLVSITPPNPFPMVGGGSCSDRSRSPEVVSPVLRFAYPELTLINVDTLECIIVLKCISFKRVSVGLPFSSQFGQTRPHSSAPYYFATSVCASNNRKTTVTGTDLGCICRTGGKRGKTELNFGNLSTFTIFAIPKGFLPCYSMRPDGGIGRRVGLKHQWPQGCAGSIPAPGT